MSDPTPGNAEPQLGSNVASGPDAERAKLELGVPGRATQGWYSRGFLPHRDELQLLQSITFRQADSLPQEKPRELEEPSWGSAFPENQRDLHRRKQIEAWLDAGMGSCALAHAQVATIMQETLLYHDATRYALLAWCIMPNHVHVLIKPNAKLAIILQSWKSFTGRWVMGRNAELGFGVPGTRFWMREYWDRYVRNEAHLQKVITYIHENPVKAHLCQKPEDWPWSSVSEKGNT